MSRVDLGINSADRSCNVQMDLSAVVAVERHPHFLERKMGGEACIGSADHRLAAYTAPPRSNRTRLAHARHRTFCERAVRHDRNFLCRISEQILLAHSNSCLSDAGDANPLCNFNGTGSGFLRRWDDAGNVGLSPVTDHDLHSNGATDKGTPKEFRDQQSLVAASAKLPIDGGKAGQRQRELGLLSDLLAPYTGESALQTSSALLDSHGSIASLLVQLRHRLPLKVDLPGQALARIEDLMSVLLHAWEAEAYRGPVLSSSVALHRYLQIEMAGAPRENFRVLFLDAANHLLLDRTMWEGTVSSVQTHPREIVRLALLHNATALILAHNHPSGCTRPSREDIKITQNIINACRPLDICVHDHLIISRNGVASIMHNRLPMNRNDQQRHS